MLIIINLSLAIIGEGIHGSVDSLTINFSACSQWKLAGDAVFQLTAYSSVNGNQSLRLQRIVIGGRCSFPFNRLFHCKWKSIAPPAVNSYWRAMQDSNPRLRLRRPEGYPDYPNRP